jgi:glycosyltransferase involved in cell wall biosynthesis
LHAQEFKDFECIVVDDGSTDKTVEIASELEFTRVVLQKNQGPGSARNHGAEYASGKYLAFLDSDDRWFPWTLRNYWNVIQESGAVMLSGIPIEVYRGDSPQILDSPPSWDNYQDYFDAGSSGVWIGGCNVCILRSAFQRSGGFMPGRINAEDSFLWLQLGEEGPFTKIISPPSFLYRRSEDSATADVTKTSQGILSLLDHERQNTFPGGKKRKREREQILSFHARPACVASLRQGDVARCWKIYVQTLSIHLKLLRGKFLVAIPIMLFLRLLRRRT